MSVLSRTDLLISYNNESYNDRMNFDRSYQNSNNTPLITSSNIQHDEIPNNQNSNNQNSNNEILNIEPPNKETSNKEPPNNQNSNNEIGEKFNRLWDLGVWIIAFLISMALCLPGIIISIQYSTDACVRKSGAINLALDGWLFIACMFVFIYMLVWLLFICTRVADRVFKCYWIIIHCLQIAWYSIGIYLIINSTMECEHNSLWEMAVAYCVLMGTAWLTETVMMIFKWCCTNNTNCLSACFRKCSNNCCSCNEELRNETYYIMTNYQKQSSLNQNSMNQGSLNQGSLNQGSLMDAINENSINEDSLLSDYHINDNDCIVDWANDCANDNN